ncbi:hypothetical protein L1049_007835 [Liquidambar formosana]|uniref:Transducin family protein / WD-40 repeat family protein n=1 Tax=Liquidambar formosana TaxID=63359 RepID=A0AAP0S3D2_LIQFO
MLNRPGTKMCSLSLRHRDGRIKVIGGDNIEALLISPKQLPYKNLEFLQNQGFLVSISNDNDIQVWNLESRCIACCLQWESNITAFSVIDGSHFMYIGDEYGSMSVVDYKVEDGKLLQFPYHISANSICEAAGFPSPSHQPIVGVLPQPCSSGNRVLIAYENGMIVLWDVLEARIVVVKGDKDLHLKDGVVDSPSEVDANLPHLEEKEISALCWASSDGSILAETPSHCLTLVRKQRSSNDRDGQLFIYGGDEMGSEEVLTVLSLEWSPGMETLRCVGRADLTLNGSFADMILLPIAGATAKSHDVALFVLTNPGQLHFYDDASLSVLISQKEKKPSISALGFPTVIPTADPYMTVAKLSLLDGNSSKSLSEMASVMKVGLKPTQAGGTKWPLTGGVPSQLSFTKDKGIERVYIAGYQDGSVRMWDATHPVLSLIFVLEGEVQGIKVAGSSASVTKLDFCFLSLRLAVGNECGLVRVYDFNGTLDDPSFHFITESKHEVHTLPQGKRPQCRAAFCLLNSPIETLKSANHGAKLAVGFGCGRVAVLDLSLLSVLFLTDSISGSSCPVISVIWKAHTYTPCLAESPKPSGSKKTDNPVEELIFILTKDAKVKIIDGGTGNMMISRPMHLKKDLVAISMYVIEGSSSVSGTSTEKEQQQSSQEIAAKNESMQDSDEVGTKSFETKHHSFTETANSGERILDSFLLLCCEDALRLYSTKSVIQGNSKCIRKVKLAKTCCWTTTFKKDKKVCGLVLLYQTGVTEIRSFPDLDLLQESSLMSILRWNLKPNMDKTISSSDNGQIALANGYELVYISLLAGENDFRIPESLPCLHDKVLAAAADAAINFSANQKKKQVQRNDISIL